MSTPIVEHPRPEDIVIALNECIETCIDGEKGYAIAAADARDPGLRTVFQRRSKERADFVLALQAAIQALGSFAENEGTARAPLHRGWIDLRLALEGRTDRVILEECRRGEQAALNAYEKALRRAPLATLPQELRKLVQEQYASIEAALEDTKTRLTTFH